MSVRKRPFENATGQLLLQAAQALFLEIGFKKTSMEAIAKRAGVTKMTLYAYFAEKEQLFDAVCDTLSQAMGDAAAAAAARARSPAAAVLASLREKYLQIWRVMRGSAHASEILQAALAASSPATKATHERYVDALAELLEAAGMKAKLTQEWARMLVHAAEGLTLRAASEQELARQLELLAKVPAL